MLIAKCKHFDAVDHLKNNILHYACKFVCLKTRFFFFFISNIFFRIMNQLLKVFYDEVHLHHSLKRLIMKIKRKYIFKLIIILFYFIILDR
jgi:hypothetical protein